MMGRVALRQHNFSPKVEYAPGIPVIMLTTTVATKLETYMQCAGSIEVSCLGAVKRLSESVFLVYEVFLAEESNVGAFTEMHKRGLNKLAYEIMERPDGEEILRNLRFWWHYHVDFGTNPSGHDEDQTRVFVEEHKKDYPFFIRAIANRTGRIQFTLFLRSGVTINDVPWELAVPQDDALIAQAQAEYKEKIDKPRLAVIPARTVGAFGLRGGFQSIDRGPHAAPGKRYGSLQRTSVAPLAPELASDSASPSPFFLKTPAGSGGEELGGADLGVDDAGLARRETIEQEVAASEQDEADDSAGASPEPDDEDAVGQEASP